MQPENMCDFKVRMLLDSSVGDVLTMGLAPPAALDDPELMEVFRFCKMIVNLRSFFGK